METENRDKVDEVIEELFTEMYQSLLRIAKRTLDPFYAENAVQNTFLRATLKFDSMMASGNVRGWLVNTLKGEIENKKRYMRRQEQRSILVDDFELFAVLNGSGELTANDDGKLWEIEDMCIREVGEEMFALFKERYIYCTPIKDAAMKYGMSESAYKSRTARIKKRLQKVLKNYF